MIATALTFIVILLALIVILLAIIAQRMERMTDEMIKTYWRTHHAYEKDNKRKIENMLTHYLEEQIKNPRPGYDY